MRIAVILSSNIYTAPFYNRYEEIFDKKNLEFDLIYWNRAQIVENIKGNPIEFSYEDQVNSGKMTKVFKYILFANFVRKKLLEKDYTHVFFLGTYGANVALLSNFLKRYYSKRYWLDIRDYTFENFKPYYLAMKKAIKNSNTTVISSPGFKDFLPDYPYIIAHNIDYLNISKSKSALANKKNSKKVRISFIGLVRYYEENKKLLEALKNDERFVLQYYGANSEVLKEYCRQNNIYNVNFHGRFKPDETATFYAKTDIINNIYGNNTTEIRKALSNKLYFASMLKLPILVSPNTFMAKVVEEYGLGLVVDFDRGNVANKIYDYYSTLNKDLFGNNCNKFNNKVIKEDSFFMNSINKFLTE